LGTDRASFTRGRVVMGGCGVAPIVPHLGWVSLGVSHRRKEVWSIRQKSYLNVSRITDLATKIRIGC
jgi:hypothetical protein